jgi:hypothetical protein
MDDQRPDSARNEIIAETLYRLNQADRQLFAVVQTEIPLSGELLAAYGFLQEAIAALSKTIPAASVTGSRTGGPNSTTSARGARFA